VSSAASSHIDYRPGWRYLTLGIDGGMALRDEYVAAFEEIIVDTLGDHRYRLHRVEEWVIIGVAPPDAAAHVARLEAAFASLLGAHDDPTAEDDICTN
jgi:hypothetical protein